MRLIECKRRNEDNCLSADFSAAETHYSVGLMIKLQTNIVPELGLYNNARGWIRDIIYLDDSGALSCYKPSEQSRVPILVCEFPTYIGKPISEVMAEAGKSTWVPIAALTLRCDCNKCHRTGLPATVAKADSVHSLQGVTIGSGKPIERCIIHWTKDAESKWPGIFYVAASRPMASGDFSLAGDLTLDALASVGASDGWKKQDKEMTRLTGLSMQARRNARSVVTKPWHQEDGCHHGSRQDYVKRIEEFVGIVEAELRSASTGNPLQPPALGSAGASVRSECEACLAQWRASFLREGEKV